MDPITSLFSSVMEKASEVAEVVGDKFMKDVCPDFLKTSTTEVPSYQIEAAAHSACNFFGMNDIPMQEGDSIGVYTFNPDIVNDDVFQYNVQQFKDMGLTSFEDQTKVWTHECGHRITQKEFGNTNWADELGADFFVGVREEMLGIGKSNFEKTLGATKPCESHPGGALRLKAIDFGRQVAAAMKQEGIMPTWENCLDAFAKSDFARMSYESFLKDTKSTALQNIAPSHPQISKELKGFTQADVDWYEHQARISSGSEQAHWIKEAQWAKNHLKSLCEDGDMDNVEPLTFKGFTQADVDWYEHQARISSGSEQAHWIKEAQWARNHLKSFIQPESEKGQIQEGHVLW